MFDLRHDKLPHKILCLSYGVSPEQYRFLSSYDLACLVRAGQAKERRSLEWMRWAVSVVVSHIVGQVVEPDKLFSFSEEVIQKKEVLKELDAEDEKAREFFKKAFAKEFGTPKNN